MIIILEGGDAVGKTTVARILQDKIPLSTLLKLSGSPKWNDSPEYMKNVYWSLVPFFSAMRHQHIICDRFTCSERAYSRLFKSYYPDYLDEYEKMLNDLCDVRVFYLSADTVDLWKRLDKKRLEQPNEKHPSLQKVKEISQAYERMFSLECKFSKVYHINTSLFPRPEAIADVILGMLNLNLKENESAYSDL